MTQKRERPDAMNTGAFYPERNDDNDQDTETDSECKELVMARQRLIDPNETKIENFASMTPHARLLLVFLRCYADRIGRLVENHFQLKFDIFPIDNVVIADLLDELAKHKHINRYSVKEQKYIQLVSWKQNPHLREPQSEIPNPDGQMPTDVGVSTVLAPGRHSSGPVPAPVQHSASLAVRDPVRDPDPDLRSSLSLRARGESPEEDNNAQGQEPDLQAEIRRTTDVFTKKGKSPAPQPHEIALFEKHLAKRLKGIKPHAQVTELRRRVDILFGENCPSWVWDDKKGKEILRFDMPRMVAIEAIWDALGVEQVSRPVQAEQPTGFVGGRTFGRGAS